MSLQTTNEMERGYIDSFAGDLTDGDSSEGEICLHRVVLHCVEDGTNLEVCAVTETQPSYFEEIYTKELTVPWKV